MHNKLLKSDCGKLSPFVQKHAQKPPIHHNRLALHKIDVAYQVDPEKDLISFCANCHTMFDRSNNPPTLEKLKDAMRKQESI